MPALVDRDRDDRQPAGSTIARGTRRPNGSSTANRRAPPAASARAMQAEALREPRRHDDVRGLRGRPADPVEVAGERRSAAPARRARRGSRAGRPAPSASARRIDRSQAARGNSVDVGPAGPEVELPGRGELRGPRGRTGVASRPGGHPRRAARPALEVALGDELLVRLDDDAPRHAELGRERARRGQGPSRPPAARRGSPARSPPRAAGGAARRRRGPAPRAAPGPNWSSILPSNWTLAEDHSASGCIPIDGTAATSTREDPSMDALLILSSPSPSSPSWAPSPRLRRGHPRRLRRHGPADVRGPTSTSPGGPRAPPGLGRPRGGRSRTSPPAPGPCSSGRGTGEGLLATVRDPLPPRIHPVYVGRRRGPPAHRRPRGSAKAARPAADGRSPSTPTRTPPRRTSSSSAARATRGRRTRRSAPPPSRCGHSSDRRGRSLVRPCRRARHCSASDPADDWPPGLPRLARVLAARPSRSRACPSSPNTTTWRAACPARSRSNASSRSSSGSRRSISRSIGSLPARYALGVPREVDRRDRRPVVGAEDPARPVDERERPRTTPVRRTGSAPTSTAVPPGGRQPTACADRRRAARSPRTRSPARRRRPPRWIAATVPRRVAPDPRAPCASPRARRRELELGRVDVDRDDPPRAREHGTHHARQPDAAEADDRHASRRRAPPRS